MEKQQISALDEYNLGRQEQKISIEDRFGRVEQFPLQSWRCSDKFVAKDLAYAINRKHYFNMKINHQMEQNLNQVYNEAVCYERYCIIRQFNVFEFNKGGNLLVVQQGYKRIRKFLVPWFQRMRFGTTLTCILNSFNQITIYDLALGKSITKSVFNPPCKDNLFEVSSNMRYLYLKGQLFEIRNQRDLKVTEGLKIAQFTRCSNFFYSINRYQMFEILNLETEQLISQLKIVQSPQNLDFILLDIERKTIIQEFWRSKTRSIVQLDFNLEYMTDAI